MPKYDDAETSNAQTSEQDKYSASQSVDSLLENADVTQKRLNHDVIKSLKTGKLQSQLPDEDAERETFGGRVADKVASFGGSWTFILSFLSVLVIWMTLNITGWLFKPFDLYPFILLNLVLSCVAALQAPVIMMSQKRQEIKDRLRAENDYKINLKAEIEIRELHDKVDQMMTYLQDQFEHADQSNAKTQLLK